MNFYENSPSGSRVVPREQTARRDEANSRFSQILRTRQLKYKVIYNV